MQRIKTSDSLKELEQILEQSREFFPDHLKNNDNFELEKQRFDEKIQKGRFAYVVKRRDFYEELLQSLDSTSQKMKQTIDQSTE